MRIRPARRLHGRLRVPGDKSISHRAAIIAAMANGSSTLNSYSSSVDCASTLECLRSLGVDIEQKRNEVQVTGRGTGGFIEPRVPLDCGNSGSTMRMLAGALAGQPFRAVLTGDNSLCSRPMKRIVEPLELMGARIHTEAGSPPLTIQGARPLKPLRYALPVASAQVKSCILLAGLNADGRIEVVESHGPTRDHTERLLSWFGVPIKTQSANTIVLNGPVHYQASEVDIPGDISSAAYLIVAAALLPGSELKIEAVGLNHTRAHILSLLRSFGFEIEETNVFESCNEPRGDLIISGSGKEAPGTGGPARLDGSVIAGLIDELPLVAVLATQLPKGLEIRDAGELRLKETDRIAATVANLRAMGAEVEEFEDGLAIGGATSLRGAQLNAFGDHRIAMAFTLAALLAEGESQLEGAECVGISFPEFFELLGSVTESQA
jgi:3-phosphoshikimate 1-carboxyvinyltransferase